MDNQPSDKCQTEQEHQHENLGHEIWLCIVLEVKQKELSYTLPDTHNPNTLFYELYLLRRDPLAFLLISYLRYSFFFFS